MKELAILGIDPGTTKAYAIISLKGEIIKVFSAKEYSRTRLISDVVASCQPLIIGTDKARIPTFVASVARQFGAQVVKLEEDLSKEEKRQLVSSGSGLNDHEKDALAAAFFAYKKYSPRLQKIFRYLDKNPQEQPQQFIKMALQEELHFSLIEEILSSSVEQHKERTEHKVMDKVAPEEKMSRKYFLRLFTAFRQQQQENKLLAEKIQQLQEKINFLKEENSILSLRSKNVCKQVADSSMFKTQQLHTLRLRLQEKERAIAQLEKARQYFASFISRVSHNQLGKKLPSLQKQEFISRNRLLQIREKDLLFVENPELYSPTIIDTLVGMGVVLCSKKKFPVFYHSKFHAITINTTEIVEENKYFMLLDKNFLAMHPDRRDIIGNVLEEYKRSRGI